MPPIAPILTFPQGRGGAYIHSIGTVSMGRRPSRGPCPVATSRARSVCLLTRFEHAMACTGTCALGEDVGRSRSCYSQGHAGVARAPCPWLTQPSNSHFLPPAEIRRVFVEAGVDMSRPVITSCGAAARSALHRRQPHRRCAPHADLGDTTWLRARWPTGSGVNASVLLVGLHLAGVPVSRLSVYDGSWTEYAQRAPERIARLASSSL